MSEPTETPIERILHDLQERAKELNCLYRVDEILGREDTTVDDALQELVQALPPGWQYPDVTAARITVGGRVHEPPDFQPSPWVMASALELGEEEAGQVEVYYTEAMPQAATQRIVAIIIPVLFNNVSIIFPPNAKH